MQTDKARVISVNASAAEVEVVLALQFQKLGDKTWRNPKNGGCQYKVFYFDYQHRRWIEVQDWKYQLIDKCRITVKFPRVQQVYCYVIHYRGYWKLQNSLGADVQVLLKWRKK